MTASAEDARALRETAGWFEEPGRALLRVTGDDRKKYLHSMFSNHVSTLDAGEGRLACALTVKGRAVAFVRYYVDASSITIDVDAVRDPERAGVLLAHLRKFVVINKVVIEPCAGIALGVEGPRAEAALAQATGEDVSLSAPMAHRSMTIAGQNVRVARCGTTGDRGYRVYIGGDSLAQVEPIREAIAAATASVEGRAISHDAAEAARVAWGLPAWGVELTDAFIPPLAGLAKAAFAYDKGCYLGQEPIAMLHFRGSMSRRLMSAWFEASDASSEPVPGAEVTHDGQAIGSVVSVASGYGRALVWAKKGAYDEETIVRIGLIAGILHAPAHLGAYREKPG